MDRKAMLQDIRHAQRCLTEARKALKEGDSPDWVLQRLSLVAQYASLACHYMPDGQPGVKNMKDVWISANKACEVSMREMMRRE
jgi:hypothetical protein